jgi:hypothetical protein
MELERAAARFAVKPKPSPYLGMTLATVAPMPFGRAEAL